MDKYKELVSRIGSSLREEGFLRRGNTFYLSKNKNWGLLNFYKSNRSGLNEIIFTLNLGVSSTALRSFIGEDIETRPLIEDCHWRKRVGFFLPSKQDVWWRIIDGDTSLEELQCEITNLIFAVAIPEVEQHMSDEALMSLWLSGQAEGLTEFQRFLYLTTLLKIYRKEELSSVINKFCAYVKGKPYESSAKVHIKELGFSYV